MKRLNKQQRRWVQDPVFIAQLFRRRALIGYALIVLSFGVLIARFAYLQVVQHDEFTTRSEANRIRVRALPPNRGLIFDRNGVLLAENVTRYRLEVVPDQVGNLDELLKEIGKIVVLSEDDIKRFKELRRIKRGFESLPLRFQLSEAEVADFSVDKFRFPGVDVVPYLTRHYPMGEIMGHVVGYVGRIDVSDRETLDARRYEGTSHIGKTGIERFYEDLLLGTAGYEQVEVNAQGRLLRVLDRQSPTPGNHLYLTVDSQLQLAVAAAFEDKPGAAVAIDPRNGEVLALASLPGFDTNLFINGISQKDYSALLNAPYRPLFNRALQGGYEPGSTIKPFLGLAALEMGLRKSSDTVFSTGEFRLAGFQQAYRDWRKGGHGRVNLEEAIARSVNTYFYQLAVDMGIDRIASSMQVYGFGQTTGIDLAGEATGILPSREWKKATTGVAWYPGETVITGIGQGFWVSTPIQLASATATLANQGIKHTPHLLLAVQRGFNDPIEPIVLPAPAPTIIKDPANLLPVIRGMQAVMHDPTGTAFQAGIGAKYLIASKSGTAQRVRRASDEKVDPSKIAERFRNQALFIAYAPVEAPQIAIAIVVEHGNSGSKAAAPVVRSIFDAYLLKEQTQ